jgi:hypothetical protein
MLAKVMVSLLAVAAITYGGTALYIGGCPFSACHHRCGGSQSQSECPVSSCCPSSSSVTCTEQEPGCCEEMDVTTGLVGACGSVVVLPQE